MLGEAFKLFRRALGTVRIWEMNLPIDDSLGLLYLPCSAKKYSDLLSLGLTEHYNYPTHSLLSIPPFLHTTTPPYSPFKKSRLRHLSVQGKKDYNFTCGV
jgi:hypothetical protein